jgi:hypothetical protein
MSRPYPLREGDVIQLGVDYQGRTEGDLFLIRHTYFLMHSMI